MLKRNSVLKKVVNHRVAVNFIDSGSVFTGRLADYDGDTYVLDQCQTVPATTNETSQPIQGRQYVDRLHAYLQELPT